MPIFVSLVFNQLKDVCLSHLVNFTISDTHNLNKLCHWLEGYAG